MVPWFRYPKNPLQSEALELIEATQYLMPISIEYTTKRLVERAYLIPSFVG